MKLAIDQKVLVNALERGAMAALSDEAQVDTSSFAFLIKSVKITAGKKFIVESGTSLLSTRWEIDANKENGVEIKEEGSVFVPAKELLDWTSRQNKSKVVLDLDKLQTPEIIKTSDEDMDYGSGQALSVKKVGNLKLISRDESKTGNKWNIDCYDSDQLAFVDFSKTPKRVVQVTSIQLGEALKNVVFSSQKNDYQHIFDSIVLERYQGCVYMAASDTHRCSIYKLDQATDIDETFFTETNSKNGSMTHGQKILIPSIFLRSVSKIVECPEISISYEKEKNKVYLDLGNWNIRITTVDSSKFKGFPSVACLISKPYSKLGGIPKSILTNRLISASLVNQSVVLFNFNKGDKGDTVIIHAISESGHAPNISNAPVIGLVKSIKAVWGVKHIMEIAKILKDENVSFMVPDDLKSVKITSDEDPNLQYYSMSVDSAIYSNFFKD